MKKLGTVENVIHDGTVILRTSETPAPGTRVFDSRGAEVGRVARVFGPVSEPYVSLRPRPGTDTLQLVGAALYTGQEERAGQDRHTAGRPHAPMRRDAGRAQRASRPGKNRGVNEKWQRKGKPRKR
jgi:rRNA processing protein Gar1